MNGRFDLDPELEFLKDPELLEVATLLRSRRLPEAPLDPAFQSSLRRDLRRKHWETLETSLPWWRRLTAGPALAWSGAALGAVMIAAAVLFALHTPSPSNVAFVSSPLDHMRDVAVLQPMELTFAQPMDHQSVESALQIQPATKVSYVWQGNTLLVQPQAGQLAPNTQYRMTLAPTAATASGTPLAKPATIVFVTAAAPAPSPTVSPTPQTAGIALGTPVQLAPGGSAVAPVWSGSTLYFAGADGSLESVPAAGGTPTNLGVPAGTAIAVGYDGNSAELATLSAGAVTTLSPDGTHVQQHVAAGGLAIAWHGPGAEVALPSGIFDLRGAAVDLGHPLVKFSSPARSAVFSPDGSHLLYEDATGTVHQVDVGTGKDTAWQVSAAGLPAWSQDGTKVAFLTPQGVDTAGPDGTDAVPVATFSQLGVQNGDGVSLTWSGSDILAATPAGLTGIDATLGSAPVHLASGSGYASPSASPDRGSLAYLQDGALYTAALQRPGQEGALLSKAQAVLQAFMSARVAGDSATAAKYMDAAGQQAYAKSGLVFNGEPHLARWFSVFTQPRSDGTVVALVRLVLADSKGVEVSQLDETISLVSAADGTVSVDGLTAISPQRPVDSGPEVVGVTLTGTQLQVQFDSDLDPATLGSVALIGSAGTPLTLSPTYGNRTITFDLSSLQQGTQLQLSIPGSVKDVGGHGAAQPLTIPVVVPASS